LPDANSSINPSIDVNAATMFKIANRCKSARLVAASHASHRQGGIGECTAFAVAKSVFCDTIEVLCLLPSVPLPLWLLMWKSLSLLGPGDGNKER